MTALKVVVCVKQVPDEVPAEPAMGSTWATPECELILDDTDRYGVELGLQLTEDDGGEVALVSLGRAGAEQGLRQGLAMGVGSAFQVADDSKSGADVLTTARALAGAITEGGFDLVITGTASTDGSAGVMGAMLGELLGVPSVSDVTRVEVRDGRLAAQRQTPGGHDVVFCQLPAVISVTAGAVEPRYPTFKNVMASKRRSIETLSASSLAEAPDGLQQVVDVRAAPIREAGRTIVDDGEAFREIVAKLDELGLV
ncbi:putative electron transfer flavoprotein beta-subunit [metagenome]|uniref:Putative electron transfer flavoprotein beta-subunit n=1 Tax=metagenome TaxID=256318 RepID=A0A2P2C8X2_9ZZZZ